MSDKLSIIQHDIYHSLQCLIGVVTIVSTMLLVHRLDQCKPVDNSHENMLGYIHAFCWIGLIILVIKAFVAGTQYTRGNVVDNNSNVMYGLRVAFHCVVVLIAIMTLSYLSKTNINKCSNIQGYINQMAISDINPNNTNALVSWVIILSILVLVFSVKHLVWTIGSTDFVKRLVSKVSSGRGGPSVSTARRNF